MKEEWKPIAGFEGLYDISNLGRIKRVFAATSNLDRGYVGKIIKVTTSSKYPGVKLYKDGVAVFKTMHKLMAEAFLPNDDKTLVVNHKNADKKDWSLSNLEWVTHSENLLHAVSLKLNPMVGETHHMAKFTADDVIAMRTDWDGTYAWAAEKAKQYNCNPNTIILLLKGKTWKFVPMPSVSTTG